MSIHTVHAASLARIAKAGRISRRKIFAARVAKTPLHEAIKTGRACQSQLGGADLIVALMKEIRVQWRFRSRGHWAFNPDYMSRLLCAVIILRRARNNVTLSAAE